MTPRPSLRACSLSLLALACSPAPGPASAPTAPAPVASAPAASAPARVTEVAAPGPSTSGWAIMPDPRKNPPGRPAAKGFAACVQQLRSGASIGDAPGAYLHEQAWQEESDNNLNAARKSYFNLIQNFPASPYIPLAYLAFGEMFAADAAADSSRWALAVQAFSEVLKYPPTTNSILAYATMRAGDAHRALADHRAALTSYKQAIARAAGPSQQCGPFIREKSLDGLLAAYASVGDPARAHAFLKATLGDESATLAALERLASLLDKNPRGACAAVSGAPGAPAELKALYCNR